MQQLQQAIGSSVVILPKAGSIEEVELTTDDDSYHQLSCMSPQKAKRAKNKKGVRELYALLDGTVNDFQSELSREVCEVYHLFVVLRMNLRTLLKHGYLYLDLHRKNVLVRNMDNQLKTQQTCYRYLFYLCDVDCIVRLGEDIPSEEREPAVAPQDLQRLGTTISLDNYKKLVTYQMGVLLFYVATGELFVDKGKVEVEEDVKTKDAIENELFDCLRPDFSFLDEPTTTTTTSINEKQRETKKNENERRQDRTKDCTKFVTTLLESWVQAGNDKSEMGRKVVAEIIKNLLLERDVNLLQLTK